MRFGKISLLALLVLSASAAHAQNIVGNPGFESGSQAPWTVTITPGFFVFTDAAPSRVHSGARSDSLAAVTNPGSGTIRQNLTTVGGQAYILDFWLRDENTSHPGGTDAVNLLWDGQALATLDIAKDSAYHEFTFGVVASGTSTFLEYDSPVMSTGGSGIWRINLDDVSVTAGAVTPEPGALTLLVTSGLTGLTATARRRKAHTAA